jgi:four helix bundle protein
MQDFHNIRAWRAAHSLAIKIEQLVKRFPKSEYGRLRNQLLKSAESIADNIAEGAAASTNAEFARFLDMSIKSSSELENQIERSHGYGLIRDDERAELINAVCDVRKMTWGLRKSVLGQKPPPPPPPDDE